MIDQMALEQTSITESWEKRDEYNEYNDDGFIEFLKEMTADGIELRTTDGGYRVYSPDPFTRKRTMERYSDHAGVEWADEYNSFEDALGEIEEISVIDGVLDWDKWSSPIDW